MYKAETSGNICYGWAPESSGKHSEQAIRYQSSNLNRLRLKTETECDVTRSPSNYVNLGPTSYCLMRRCHTIKLNFICPGYEAQWHENMISRVELYRVFITLNIAHNFRPRQVKRNRTEPTLTSFVPAAMMILARKPSSGVSKSIVALSVSIWARTSPSASSSPSAFAQLWIVPSSIVGDRFGRFTERRQRI